MLQRMYQSQKVTASRIELSFIAFPSATLQASSATLNDLLVIIMSMVSLLVSTATGRKCKLTGPFPVHPKFEP